MRKESSLKKYFTPHNIALVGVLAACVFVLTKFISIPIPSPLGKTALSLGNSMCVLSALLFGPLTGGLAAGVGNALVDLTDPAWAGEFWITFINKFLLAYVAGIMMHRVKIGSERTRIWLAGLLGSLTYCVLYLGKNIITGVYLKGFTWDVAIVETLVGKLPVSVVNGILATICAGFLYIVLKRPLERAHILAA